MRARALFLVGLPRSGTTFLQRVLNAHPRILLTDETAVFLQLADLVNKSRRGVVEGIYFGKSYNELWSDLLRAHASSLFEEFYQGIARREGKGEVAYWGDKHPHYCNCMDFLWELYPNALFLMSLRDPRDVACSLALMRRVPLRQAIRDTVVFLAMYHDFFRRHPEVVPFYITYEKLVADPRKVLSEILAFLQLPLTQEVDLALDIWKTRDAHGPADATKKKDFSSNIKKWVEVFSDEDLALAEEVFGPYKSFFPLQGNVLARSG